MFDEIVGQARAIDTLRQALTGARLPNAYLFTGPPGVGKLTTALAFAAAANCYGGPDAAPAVSDGGLFGGGSEETAPATLPDDACGECASCRKILGGNHPDVRVISKAQRAAAEGRRVRDLTIEQVRPVLAELAYRAYEGRRRVVIFDGAHDLNESAQNALLKSLEEPPPDTTFVLVTDQPRRLLPTVISRSRIVRFGPVPPDAAAQVLAQRLEIPPDEARVLAAAVGGSLGRALGEHAELFSRSAREDVVREALDAARNQTALVDTAAEWSKRGDELPLVLEILAAWFRDARVRAAGAETSELIHPDLASLVDPQAGPAALDRCFTAVRAAVTELRGKAQDTRLVIEHLFLQIGAALEAS